MQRLAWKMQYVYTNMYTHIYIHWATKRFAQILCLGSVVDSDGSFPALEPFVFPTVVSTRSNVRGSGQIVTPKSSSYCWGRFTNITNTLVSFFYILVMSYTSPLDKFGDLLRWNAWRTQSNCSNVMLSGKGWLAGMGWMTAWVVTPHEQITTVEMLASCKQVHTRFCLRFERWISTCSRECNVAEWAVDWNKYWNSWPYHIKKKSATSASSVRADVGRETGSAVKSY